MGEPPDLAGHWDSAYAHGDGTRSWFQREAAMSLRMLDAAGVPASASVLDVGGGASPLAGALLGRGFRDVSVLDISAAGMRHAQRRLGRRARQIQWLTADILLWLPPRQYEIWHDRAVFHFLAGRPDQDRYLHALRSATAADALAVFGCFAPDGPLSCSGLPVSRYSPRGLARRLGSGWSLIAEAREEHVTPGGATQPFTWAVFRRHGLATTPAAAPGLL
jgi:SAM-dependent methyltransferase